MMRLIGGILLVAGTTIGASMLALPATTGMAGFWPAVVTFLIVWGFMAYTAFLFFEVTYATGSHSNLVSMARTTLGPVGEGVAWVTYLLLLYALTGAYLAGSGAILIDVVQELSGHTLSSWIGPLPFVVVFGVMIYLGIRPVDYLNRLLMVGLAICFAALIVFIGPRVKTDMLMRADTAQIFPFLSVIVTGFGFHIIVPSLVDYLDRDRVRVKTCLWLGCSLPLIIYIIWELVIVGTVPLKGLNFMLDSGQPTAQLTRILTAETGSRSIGPLAGFFSFFAIITSMLGVTLSLSDFLSDGLRLHHLKGGRFVATLLTFLPPLLFAWFFPEGFVLALAYAGVIVAVLLGILPAMMSWSLHNQKGDQLSYRTIGGKPALILTITFFAFVIVVFFLFEPLMKWIGI